LHAAALHGQHTKLFFINLRNFEMATINGTTRADVLIGTAVDDTIRGNGGNDTLIGGLGNDLLNGGSGSDTASYEDVLSPVTVNLAIGTAQNTGGGGFDTLISIENLMGGSGNDYLTGNASNNVLAGGSGDDTLDGGAGNDSLVGGVGNDILIGGAGRDTLDGGTGTDTASYATTAGNVTVSLAITGAQVTGGAGTDTLIAIENLTGGSGNDTLTGDAGNNVLDGGSGNDLLTGGAGDDTLIGGPGNDTASYANAAGGVNVNLSITGAQITGAAGSDTLISIENISGGAAADTLTGDGLANILRGGGGDDFLIGGIGNDTLDGGLGNDTFRYTATSLTGGDIGAGQADTIVASAGDRIDFSSDLEAIIRLGGQTLAGLTANVTVGAAFDANNNIRFVGGHLQIDINGDNLFTATADFDSAVSGATAVAYDAVTDTFNLTNAAPTRRIALTFDDGPEPTYTPQVLAVLARYGVHATFFEIGEQIDANPALARAVVDGGNLLENHSYTHPSLISLSNAEIRSELQQTSLAIVNATGMTPTFFRPPYGDVDSNVMAIGSSLGLQSAVWTADTLDWSTPGVDAIVNAALSGATDQGIILMHDGGGNRAQTVAALDQIIPALLAQGYELVTIDQLTIVPHEL
jgi:peptidoglycan/xylan/chitin deacetylase (PgdA/CDA1 family)